MQYSTKFRQKKNTISKKERKNYKILNKLSQKRNQSCISLYTGAKNVQKQRAPNTGKKPQYRSEILKLPKNRE